MANDKTPGTSETKVTPQPAGINASVDASALAAAERITRVPLTPDERSQAVAGFAELLRLFEQRRAVPMPNGLSPAISFKFGSAVPPDSGALTAGTATATPAAGKPAAGKSAAGKSATATPAAPPSASPTANAGYSADLLPADDRDIAFAPVTMLAAWIRGRLITSERLTRLYLDRLRRYGDALRCVAVLTEERALKRAREADREIAAGRYRGTLHGIPWGAKDLLDTAGIETSWGAEPYGGRIPEADAEVVRRLDEAGAVLVAKLSLGALAYGDVWFRGRTNNPWNVAEGSSGSSAGSAAAVSAGLVGFAIGTETMGSIVSPSLRCGTTGLRPTFGRVPRTGAMALCWSFDKIGPICRTVGDTLEVFAVIHGADGNDIDAETRPFASRPWSVPPASPDPNRTFPRSGGPVRPSTPAVAPALAPSATFTPSGALGRPGVLDGPGVSDRPRVLAGVRVGYDPAWFDAENVTNGQRAVLEILRANGAELYNLTFPDLPYDALMILIFVEAASAFEELTLGDLDDELRWQGAEAWPNTFRMSRFIPAVEYVQAQRIRRKLCLMMAEVYSQVDLIVSPGTEGPMLVITNGTGNPSLTLRAGFHERPNAPDIGEGGGVTESAGDDDEAREGDPASRPAGAAEPAANRTVPCGINLWGRLWDESLLCLAGSILEKELAVWDKRPPVGA